MTRLLAALAGAAVGAFAGWFWREWQQFEDEDR